jgi:nucleotide-binding universal stress UspA family protein/quercetin dioxygenase-like cupin family protein
MSRIRTILHPTDFSENARYAFRSACIMARENDATLLVLHVMGPSAGPWQRQLPSDPMRAVMPQNLWAQFPWDQPSDPKIREEHRVAEGNPAEEILRLASLVPCDLIVMGTHGRSGLGRFLTGSVAEEVMRKAVCPVFVVRIPLRPAPEIEVETTANPRDVVDVRPAVTTLGSTRTRTLVRSTTLDVVRQIVPAGQEISGQIGTGDVVAHCLEGSAAFTVLGRTQTLKAGQFLHFPSHQPYAFRAIEDACFLLTTVLARRRHD